MDSEFPSPLDPVRKRVTVAIVAPSLRYVGGQAVQADLLVRSWQNDLEVEARWVKVDPPLPRMLAWAEHVPVLRTILREPIYFLGLWRGLKDVDVAHIFAASYWSFLLAPAPAVLWARVLGKKTVLHYHSGEASDHLKRFRSARLVLSRVDQIVVPSEYLAGVFRESGLHTAIIPNLVDSAQFQYRERVPLRPHLVCTRGFHEYYCVDAVVAAFGEVQKEFPDAQLDLVGSGPLEGAIRKQVAELELSGVNFAGVASRAEIGKFYDQADIFINASKLDNQPVSIIEAFRAGTPVVTTAPHSIPHLVEHERNGLLSNVSDTKGLAANVVRLLRDPALAARLATNAYGDSQKYTWQSVRRQWLNAYRALIP
jgi:L-malate glycosyltransferase